MLNALGEFYPTQLIADYVCPYQFLDWTQRPEEIQEKVDIAFDSLKDDSRSSRWAYNGDYQYHLAGGDEYKIVREIFQKAAPNQKDFYFLDIGAGNFKFNWSLARYINDEIRPAADIFWVLVKNWGIVLLPSA